MAAIVSNASDRVTLDVGGEIFETTKSTLTLCGAGFFQALFDTGKTIGERSNDESEEGSPDSNVKDDKGTTETSKKEDVKPRTTKKARQSLFLDRDGEIFRNVLYFMRTNTIHPKILFSWKALKALKTEAEFFAYDGLLAACNSELKKLEKCMEEGLSKKTQFAVPKTCIVRAGGRIDLSTDGIPGEVFYIVSATLAGRCKVNRYSNYDDENIPGCFIQTAGKNDTGDFQLLFQQDDDDTPVCLAHVGMDHIHTGNDDPVNFNFRQDLRICVAPKEGEEYISLSTEGAADWHISYWIGLPEAIPGLGRTSSTFANRWNMLGLTEEIEDDDEDGTGAMRAVSMFGLPSL